MSVVDGPNAHAHTKSTGVLIHPFIHPSILPSIKHSDHSADSTYIHTYIHMYQPTTYRKHARTRYLMTSPARSSIRSDSCWIVSVGSSITTWEGGGCCWLRIRLDCGLD